jgi:hypothetical protein
MKMTWAWVWATAFLTKKLCMASVHGSVKLKICNLRLVGKKWSAGKAFTDATYTDH